MKNYKPSLLFSIFISLIFIAGCGKTDDEYLYSSQQNTMVRSFALQADTNILPNLEKIFFTIDLKSGEIYNADSLPYGTKISALAMNVTFNNASNVVVNYYEGSNPDIKSFDYFQYSTAKVDFTNSEDDNKPVRIRVYSQSGTDFQTYRVKVNVHKVVADTLYWQDLLLSKLPEGTNDAKSGKCVKAGDGYYFFYQSQDGVSYCTRTPDFTRWTASATLSLPSMEWRSLISDGSTLYAVSSDGRLFTCNDLQTLSFSESTLLAGYEPYSLIGFLSGKMVAIVKDNGVYKHAVVPTSGGSIDIKPVSGNFPVSGFSSPVTLTSIWGSPQLVIACGTLSDGATLTNAVWGFDGSNWAILNNITTGNNGAPITPRTGATLLPYYTYTYNQNYDVHTKVLTYFIIGGWDGTQALNDLYYTTNLGGVWSEADDKSPLKLPEAITPRLYADAFVLNKDVPAPVPTPPVNPDGGSGENATQGWVRMDVPKMPAMLRLMAAEDTETVAPYIYMVGGSSSIQYSFINEIWKGVILRLTFAPIP